MKTPDLLMLLGTLIGLLGTSAVSLLTGSYAATVVVGIVGALLFFGGAVVTGLRK